jgi:hypothetical protein
MAGEKGVTHLINDDGVHVGYKKPGDKTIYPPGQPSGASAGTSGQPTDDQQRLASTMVEPSHSRATSAEIDAPIPSGETPQNTSAPKVSQVPNDPYSKGSNQPGSTYKLYRPKAKLSGTAVPQTPATFQAGLSQREAESQDKGKAQRLASGSSTKAEPPSRQVSSADPQLQQASASQDDGNQKRLASDSSTRPQAPDSRQVSSQDPQPTTSSTSEGKKKR